MFERDFPSRSVNHIKETASYKIFKNQIPNHWIVRELSERDYGIDALIELVDSSNKVTGELVSIQLKSTQSVDFGSESRYRHYNVGKRTTNYWLNSSLITFVFLVDEGKGLMFMKSVDDHVRMNYPRYADNDTFYYEFYDFDVFDAQRFLDHVHWAKCLRAQDNDLSSIMTVHRMLSSLYEARIRRDYHMLVDEDDVLSEFSDLYALMEKLCGYLNVNWDIPTARQFVDANPIGVDAEYDNYFIYEYHMTELLLMLDRKMSEMILRVRGVACRTYRDYWWRKNCALVSFLDNAQTTTLDQRYWASKPGL
ncbi:hypothetical protein PS718_00515 [Pseudomonas fluorescens]|uniref:DUF4365 domain-containing protein n=1 Tax=Pseudomonas fluorescens TaxID=294 RepID=A0A5E7ABX0_PSEFL|nr:DUF4365 domain-containing protein [Pseudomonas fluorescens]VVN72583.1 hypothetical protein PS718_00515 [Pseudomonas fluorescens]